MAKTGFWLQGAKGKFAGAALQKGAFGGTIMRQITTPKNPRSVPQMVQRVCTSTISHAYSALKEICDHSFEGVTYGAQSMAYFRKINSKKLQHYIDNMSNLGAALNELYLFNVKGDKNMMPIQALQVSEGTLTPLKYNVFSDYVPHGQEDTVSLPAPGFNFLNPDGNAYFANEMAVFGSDYNLQVGDQITFVLLTSKGLSQVLGAIADFKTSLQPIFLRTKFAEGDDFLGAGNKFMGTDLVATIDSYQEGGETVKKIVGLTYEGRAIVSVAVIVSRKQNGNWLRSTAYMTTFADNDGMVRDDADWMISDLDRQNCSLYDAIQSYYGESADVPSDYYLNNARA